MGLTSTFSATMAAATLSLSLAMQPSSKEFDDHIRAEIALRQQQEARERQAAQEKQSQTVFEQLQAAQLRAAAEQKAAYEASPQYQAQLAQKKADDAAANRSILGGTMALLTGATLLKELEGVTPLAPLAGKAGVFAREGGFTVASTMPTPQVKEPNPVMAFLTPTPTGAS